MIDISELFIWIRDAFKCLLDNILNYFELKFASSSYDFQSKIVMIDWFLQNRKAIIVALNNIIFCCKEYNEILGAVKRNLFFAWNWMKKLWISFYYT